MLEEELDIRIQYRLNRTPSLVLLRSTHDDTQHPASIDPTYSILPV